MDIHSPVSSLHKPGKADFATHPETQRLATQPPIPHSQSLPAPVLVMKHKISESMDPDQVAQIIRDLERTALLPETTDSMPYNLKQMELFVKNHHSGLKPSDQITVRNHINRLICRDMPKLTSEGHIFLIQSLLTFTSELGSLSKLMNSANIHLLRQHFETCYEAVSAEKVKKACDELKQGLATNDSTKLVCSVELLGKVCQLHKRTLPDTARQTIILALAECIQPITALLEVTENSPASGSLSVRLAKAILYCWIIIPKHSPQPCPSGFCRVTLLPLLTCSYKSHIGDLHQRWESGSPPDLKVIENLKGSLTPAKVVWEQQSMVAEFDELMTELEGLRHKLISKQEPWPALASSDITTGSQAHPPATRSTQQSEEEQALCQQMKHLEALMKSLSPIEDDRPPILPKTLEHKDYCLHHGVRLLPLFDSYTSYLLQHIPDDLNPKSALWLRLCKTKLKALQAYGLNPASLLPQLKRIYAHLYLRKAEQAVRTGKAAEIEYLDDVNEKWDLTHKALDETDKSRLTAITTDMAYQNLCRVNLMLSENNIMQGLAQWAKVSIFVDKHPSVLSAEHVSKIYSDLEAEVTATKSRAASQYLLHSINSWPLLSDHRTTNFKDAMVIFGSLFGYLQGNAQQHLMPGLLAIMQSQQQFCMPHPELFFPLLQHPVIANSYAGALIRQWQSGQHHSSGTWQIDWSYNVRALLMTLFNPASDGAPRLVLYGSQLHCALISCLYQVDSNSIPIVPSDFDLLFEKDRLYDVLVLITRNYCSKSLPEEKLREIVSIYLTPGKFEETSCRRQIDTDNHAMSIDLKGYDCGKIKRSLAVIIKHKNESKPDCKIDLIPCLPHEMPVESSCCQFTTLPWQQKYGHLPHTPSIRGIGIVELFEKLSLGLSAPESDSENKGKELERYTKSAQQLQCWIDHEQRFPRLAYYSPKALFLLRELERKKQWMDRYLAEVAPKKDTAKKNTTSTTERDRSRLSPSREKEAATSPFKI
ncbi:hypothetical protein ACWJJH_18585 [Endozoicomonadaceae bacterium StTr2]